MVVGRIEESFSCSRVGTWVSKQQEMSWWFEGVLDWEGVQNAAQQQNGAATASRDWHEMVASSRALSCGLRGQPVPLSSAHTDSHYNVVPCHDTGSSSALVKGASRQARHHGAPLCGHARQQRQLQLHAAVLHAVHRVLADLAALVEVELWGGGEPGAGHGWAKQTRHCAV